MGVKPLLALVLGVLALLFDVLDVEACTAIAVSGGASEHGWPIVATNGDAKDGDWRLAKVPGARWEAGSKRPVYEVYQYYPHTVDESRSPTWSKKNLEDLPQAVNWTKAVPIGYIPQVEQTFGLIESGLGYGLINEHQVSMGESSCETRFIASPVSKGGKALFDVGALTMIALERAKTAREAIKIMGKLAEEYGYYGAEFDGPAEFAREEAGEAIPVGDTREAWMFHIAPDDTGASALWVAQRIPEGHVSIAANAFVVRNVKKGDPDFMYSNNLWEVAKRNHLWSERDGELDFALVYGSEAKHSIYAGRRVWRVFSKLAPSLNLDADGVFPFSIQVDKVVTVADVMDLTRDHFENTQFDLTKGVSGGPYGDPDRYDQNAVEGLTQDQIKKGNTFERAISLYRTCYAYVAAGRANLPDHIGALLWYVPHQPSDGAYVPVYAASKTLPKALTVGSHFELRQDSLWWKYCLVSNWAHKYYTHIMKHLVKPEINRLESSVFEETARAEKEATKLWNTGYKERAIHLLGNTTDKYVRAAALAWDKLFVRVVSTYHDGYRLENPAGNRVSLASLFYPKDWLYDTGFFDPFPASENHKLISLGWFVVTVALAALLSALAGYIVATRRSHHLGYDRI
eukprot:CFRG2483T1